MKETPRQGGSLQEDNISRRHGGAGWPRRLLAGALIVACVGVAAVSRDDSGEPMAASGGQAERGQPVPRIVPEAALGAFSQAVSESWSWGERASGASRTGLDGLIVLAAADPEKDAKLEGWREDGIRMAAELTGIPEAFFRWLQDKGVPVGEFMRFLMPFLEWLEMVEPHNGTGPTPKPQPQDKPQETAV